MRRSRSDGDTGPLTLGKALAAKVRLTVWCKVCGHRAEPMSLSKSLTTALA